MLFKSILGRGVLLAAVLSAGFTAPVWAQSAAGVTVNGAWVRGTVAGQGATGAFMEITASEAATLVGVSSPVAGVSEVHEMTMDNGIMKMRAMPKLDLPAGKTVTLKPGSYHLMLMDLKQTLKKGDSVPLTLKIEGKDKKPTTLEIKAEVRDLTAQAGAVNAHHHH